MATHGPLDKPSMASMPVLLFLADHPELLIVSSSTGISRDRMHFHYHNGSRYRDRSDYKSYAENDEDKPKQYYNDPAPEIPKNLATHRWLQSGWMKNFNRGPSKSDDKNNPNNHWAWYDHPYQLTDAGRVMANKWRSEYDKVAAAKELARKKVERYIVVSNTGGDFFGKNQRKYAALCKVIKETDKRIYVERVITPEEPTKYSNYVSSIQGSHLKQYIARDVIVADGVTIAEYEAMRRVETANITWLSGIKEREEAELDVIRERYDLQREQGEAMFADELREELAKVNNDG
jgi:hypothetical protein